MRKLIFLALLPVACIASTKTNASAPRTADSTKVTHVADGDISEWAPGKFETDPETKVQYAVDHDANNVFVVMKITEKPMQVRATMGGMKMFLDTRGKKKEGTGIEFPVRRRTATALSENEAEARATMEGSMLVLKLFGFDDVPDRTQFIGEEGSDVKAAYKWDAQNNLCIEYMFPTSFLGKQSSIKDKPLSVGWKINEMKTPPVLTAAEQQKQYVSNLSTSGGSARGSRGGRGGGGGGTMPGSAPGAAQDDDDPKGVYIWTKHVMNF